ncbi:hypothetical protein G7046_g3963 [Stylonectria norvegica]|nr:hypothetical protein G7046_g3963 [Stylonectria norvegica]
MSEINEIVIPVFPSFTKIEHHAVYPYIQANRPELSVAGKNVVITGAGSGIGRATAIGFSQAGAKSVSILGRRLNKLQETEALIKADHPRTVVISKSADLTKREEVDSALQSIVAQVGKIDIFVSNAGMLPGLAPVVGYELAELNRAFNLNVASAFNAINAFVPLAAPGAKLFSISTGVAHIAPFPGMFAYAATKAALTKMVEYVAAENPAIHVVQVQPGVVTTEIQGGVEMESQDPPELPGNFLVWLASREAEFLKSKFVWVNWDAEEMISRAEEIKNSFLLTIHLDGVDM